ncbi:PREDICTED: uncharacterized protein LOC109584624 [Amphimedon queenslandica]|nr:PREDICTED: uncharacterized protein LOC109584624 [Amphimedon queenslandica]|eukprot:XP_019856001.1 PREDICTED: uncharacterized protein LOC109584624 [Amphimedon queenslandica]
MIKFHFLATTVFKMAGATEISPAEIFLRNIPDLSENIGKSFNFDRLLDRLHSDGLLSESFVSDVTSRPSSEYQKGSSVVRELYRQLKSRLTADPKQFLLRICNALLKHEDQTLKGLGRSMKRELTGDETNTIEKEETSKEIKKSNKDELDYRDLDVLMETMTRIHFPTHKWSLLGLQLGLYKHTLDDIEANCRGKTAECLTECLSLWVNKRDKVTEKGGPIWSSLKTAIEKIGESSCAEKIDISPSS